MKTILITGGAGFVGSNLAIGLKKKYPAYKVMCMDNLRRRGSELNLLRLREVAADFIHGDIRNLYDFPVGNEKIDCVIDAAAEPSVLAGLDGQTDYLIQTNLNGTINALTFAQRHHASFIFLSTSRVYPIHTIEHIQTIEEATRFSIAQNNNIAGVSSKGISEALPLQGSRSLYGATKLASELMVEEWNEMFGLKTVTNRCGVLTGPYQMGKVDQGVVVLWMARHFWKGNLTYNGYGGTGKQVRDLLHVDDLFRLVDVQIHDIEKFNGQTFNVGGGNEVSASLVELTDICSQITGNKISIKPVPETRKADIRLYITDNSKINALCGWKPSASVTNIMQEIFEWIKQNEKQLKPILN